MGLNMKERQAVTREYRPRYQKATRKEKKAVLDEFTRLTGYHRKSAVKLLGAKPARQATVHANGRAVKLKPEKRRPGNRKGRPVLRRRGHRQPPQGLGVLPVQAREDTRPAAAAADRLHRVMAGLRHNARDCDEAGEDKPRDHRPAAEERPRGPRAEGKKPHETGGFAQKPVMASIC